MTGFGDASAQIDGVHYFVELRTLNNKYFKATIRLAEEYQALEAEIESRLRENLARGSVVLNARTSDVSATAAHKINALALTSYIEQLQKVGAQTGNGHGLKIDPSALLLLPGVLQPPLDGEDRLDRARKAFFPLIDRAVKALISMREREGASLIEDLQENLTLIAKRLGEISKLAPGVVADYEQRLKTRIEMLIKDSQVQVNAADLIREIAVYAERSDVAEEVKRLSVHLEQFGELVAEAGGKPIGRTLDFLAQEMLREANTIASKSPDAGIAKATVEIKGAIDRIKEQVQNLE
jgi:uncharacterized protein (TIGR00255 family)